MTLGQMLMAKMNLNLTCYDIATGSGVPISTVRKIFSEQTKRPRKETLIELSDFFESKYVPVQVEWFRKEALRTGQLDYGCIGDKVLNIHEPSAYSASGEARAIVRSVKTIEDFDNAPMEPWVELINGEFVEMEFTPIIKHQDAISEIFFQAKSYIRNNKGKCKAMFSPVAVQPDEKDDKNVFLPDFLVVCDEKKMKDGRHVIGAPDWVVEVLSPSTRNKDMTTKRDAYKRAEVREYWMVDLEGEYVIIYEFAKTDVPSIKLMRDPIPVGIYDGKLEIDLSELIDNGDE